MDRNNVISYESAMELALNAVAELPGVSVPLERASGRRLAQDIVAKEDLPNYASSFMDGYALRSQDVAGASVEQPVTLSVLGTIGAGHGEVPVLQAGQSVRIMTGGVVPDSADGVVKLEDCEGDGEHVIISSPVKPYRWIMPKGHSFKNGALVVAAGQKITPRVADACAQAGAAFISVHPRPRVGILTTGTELVEVGEVPEVGQIRSSNKSALTASCVSAGCIPVAYPVVADNPELLAEAVLRAARECDLIVSTGGSDGGDFDFSADIAEKVGKRLFSAVNMRPGFGTALSLVENVPWFAFPGRPGAAIISFELMVRPVARKMMGESVLSRKPVQAKLTNDLRVRDNQLNVTTGQISRGVDGTLEVATHFGGEQGVVSGNCLIVDLGMRGPLSCGDQVDCLRTDISEDCIY